MNFVLLCHCVFINCSALFENVLGKCSIQKCYTVFYIWRDKSREEIQVELNAVYGEQSPSLATIKRWFNDFKARRTSVVDMEKSGRPSEINEITAQLHEIIQNERKITTRELTSRLNVSKDTLQTLLSTSGIRKLHYRSKVLSHYVICN